MQSRLEAAVNECLSAEEGKRVEAAATAKEREASKVLTGRNNALAKLVGDDFR